MLLTNSLLNQYGKSLDLSILILTHNEAYMNKAGMQNIPANRGTIS